jgi:hydantoinase/carbamoylase family amidase
VPDSSSIEIDAERLWFRLYELAEIGRSEGGGVTRLSFTEEERAAKDLVASYMREAGLEVREDVAGNLIGRREGSDPEVPVVLAGSHVDSVPNGGDFDGPLGVLAAVEALQVMEERDLNTQRPIEVVAFTDEEGARFGFGMIGSRATAGTLTPEDLDREDENGISIAQAMRDCSLDPERIGEAARPEGSIQAYVELHIEQGAILDESDIDIGVVEGIVGIRWWDVTIEGVPNHAGTTPMNRRRDAMLSAAEFALAVNRVATSMEGRQVATVGRIRAEPGAPNVIPGKVVMSLEIRDLAAAKMAAVYEAVRAEADKIAKTRQTPFTFAQLKVASEPAPTDERLRRIIAKAASSLNLTHNAMPSGAGHDAQEITHIAPTGMIFVPSVGGVSHSPKEFTSQQDMANGANVLLQTVLAIDRGELR